MSIDGAKNLGDWGRLIPVTNNVHITQTNDLSQDGLAVHVTTKIAGMRLKVHDRFDAYGNYLGSDFA